MKIDTRLVQDRIASDRRKIVTEYIRDQLDRRNGNYGDRRDTRCALEIEADNAFVNAESEKWFRAFN